MNYKLGFILVPVIFEVYNLVTMMMMRIACIFNNSLHKRKCFRIDNIFNRTKNKTFPIDIVFTVFTL